MTEAKQGIKIGDLDAGGVYVGLSASYGRPLHATLADEPVFLTLDEAFEAAARVRKQPGREFAHVPTPEELQENLFYNKNTGALKDTFNTSGSYPGSFYRSDEVQFVLRALVNEFDYGHQLNYGRNERLAVRLVW